MVYLPEHASLHSVSVRVALIHGFIEHNNLDHSLDRFDHQSIILILDFGLKSAHLPFRSGITPLSALVSCYIQGHLRFPEFHEFESGICILHGPAGI